MDNNCANRVLGLLVSNRSIIVFTGIILLAMAGDVSAGKNGPNKESAMLCHKDGWQVLVDETGIGFADEEACVSYAAEGGTLYNETQALCLVDGYQSLATSDGDPFVSTEACLNYLADGKTLVHCDFVGTSGNDTFNYPITNGQTACGFGGNDVATQVGGVFYGGEGNDYVMDSVLGTYFAGIFNGGAGNDYVFPQQTSGIFNGGDGEDRPQCRTVVIDDNGIIYEGIPAEIHADQVLDAICRQGGYGMTGGTFNGDGGNDYVDIIYGGTFNGGDGDDLVVSVAGGTFNGDGGNDEATALGVFYDPYLGNPPTLAGPPVFNGGPGEDTLDGFENYYLDTATFNGGTGDDSVVSTNSYSFDPARVYLDGGDDFDIVGEVDCDKFPINLSNFESVPLCSP